MSDETKESAISVRDLRVRYGDREILHGINFDVARGETLVILFLATRAYMRTDVSYE